MRRASTTLTIRSPSPRSSVRSRKEDRPDSVTQDYTIHDPPLSDLGVKQCAALRESLQARFSSVQPEDVAILASPMRRTLQTAQLALDWLQGQGVKIQADADWQENSAQPCDIGTPVSSLLYEFPQVDFESVDDVWPDKISRAARRYAYSKTAILERGRRSISHLYSRQEKLIFVVSHSGFLRLGVVGRWFFNSDYRVFQFDETRSGEPIERLLQDQSTTAGGLGLSRTHEVELGSDIPEEDLAIDSEGDTVTIRV